jgi:uncharacterized protein (TIGR02391 family)
MKFEPFESNLLQRFCDVLGETVGGLTGTEIGKLLVQLDIEDSNISTKRERLYDALKKRQDRDRCGNLIVAFLYAAMNPVNYLDKKELFNTRRNNLNKILSFCGLFLGEDGKLIHIEPAKTLSEAEQRADRLQSELKRRNVHSDVLHFCQAEFLEQNFFHAVFEATKSVADKIRNKSSLDSDGPALVDQALGLGQSGIPLLAFNSLQTETEKSEHKGIINLLKGMFGTFRNPLAHEPKIKWVITEQDALDLMTLVALLHRRLDAAFRTNKP